MLSHSQQMATDTPRHPTPLPLIDSHAHLGDIRFDTDRQAVLERARAVGVMAIINVSETLRDVQRNLELAGRFPMLHPAAGLYPTYADHNAADAIIKQSRAHSPHLAAIGEVGLDFWHARTPAARERQREIFSRFIALAQELELPLNVHSRSAGRQAVAMLLEHNACRVQLHAFDGKYSAALPAVEAGFFFSIPPSVLRSRQKQKLVKHLPLANLLAETDSPVLGPDPQTRNEPANLARVIEAIAQLKKLPIAQVHAAIYANQQKLYSKITP